MPPTIQQCELTEEEVGLLTAEALVGARPRAEVAAVVALSALAILVLVVTLRALLKPHTVTTGVPPPATGTAETGRRSMVRAGQARLVTVWRRRQKRKGGKIKQCQVFLFVVCFQCSLAFIHHI